MMDVNMAGITRLFHKLFLVVMFSALSTRSQGLKESTPSASGVLSIAPTNAGECRMGFHIKDYYPIENDYYHHQTCFWCYSFTPPHRKKYDLNITMDRVVFSDGKPRLDMKFVVENESYHFDLQEEEGWGHIVSSMADILEATKLGDCCREAIRCCEQSLKHDSPVSIKYMNGTTEESVCPATWDGWTCFPDTKGGDVVTFKCPPYAYKGRPECTLEGRKICWPNGTWAHNEQGVERTNYAPCSHINYHLINYYWEMSMNAVSMVAVLPAFVILPYYRPLRAQRFKLHLNFLWALFFKSFFNILDVALLRIPEYTESNTIMDDNTGGCKFLVYLTKVFSVAVWTWMLAESLYLHRLIVAAFKGGGKTYVYVLIGWVPPLILCTCWAVSRALLEDYQCWLGDDQSDAKHLYLITELPKLLILVLNTLLLANMTRVLLTTLRHKDDGDTIINRRAAKATLFLLPMFGLQFFVTFVVPPYTTPCIGMHIYAFVATAVDGLQGFYVAVVYCYINEEVKKQVKRSVQQISGSMYTSVATYDPKTEVSHIHSSVN